jgi:hypothetical protein
MERMSEKPELGPQRWPDLKPVGLIALSIAIVWSVSITANTWKSVRVKPELRTIKVVGSAKKRIVSDLIEWEAVLEARAPDHDGVALSEQREKAMVPRGSEIKKPVGAVGTFQEEFTILEEFKVVPGAKEPIRLEKKIPKGFVTRETILVRSGDVAVVEKASREVTSLLEQGLSITSGAPSYFYTRLGELKVEMLAAAGRDARARADNILKSAGGADIKRLRKTNMGIININPANSTETSNEGNNDRSSLEKDIITIVHAEFDLDE